MGFCVGKAGQDSVEFTVHVVWPKSTVCILMKNNFTLSPSHPLEAATSMRFKARGKRAKLHLKLFCSEDKTLSGNKKTRTQSRAGSGTPISSKQSHRLSVHR